MTTCPECERLRQAHSDATLRYMRFHNGISEQDDAESNRLLQEMKDAVSELYAHQLHRHAVMN